jgi:hypothetical protein
MKAMTGYSPTFSVAQERRIDLAGKIIDTLDIARRLLDQMPPDNRLAMARQLVSQCVDDVVALARVEDQPAASAEVAR